jgi:glycosyltransferase involved in cell wall biosynthesis
MRILFFIESLRAGGKERRIVELLKGLRQYPDLQITLVLTRKEIHYNEVHELGIPIHIIERKWLKKDPLLFLKFYKFARSFKPDVIHVWGHMVAVYAVPSKWLLRVPLINNEITDATRHSFLLGKGIVFNASDSIIANTQAGLDAYDAPAAKSKVIYNGFNFNRLKSLEAEAVIREKFKIKTRYVIAMVASFIDYKDWGTFVNAAKKMTALRSDVTFLCIGDGDDSVYRKLVPAELVDRVLFLGRQNKVEAIMNCCDMGVLTTNIHHHGEGISNALLEFMSLGKPVIATRHGGSVELIEPGLSGFLIEPFSVTELEEKILYLIDNPSVKETMGKLALKRVQEKFSIEGMVSSFYNEYKRFAR